MTKVGPALYLLPTVLKARGAVSLFTMVLLLGLAGVGYAGWLYIPLFLDNLDMREASSAAFNRLAHDPATERVRSYFLSRANSIGTHWEEEDGTRVEKPGLGLTDADVTMERDALEHTARVEVDYRREARLWPLARFVTFDFHVEKVGKLPQ